MNFCVVVIIGYHFACRFGYYVFIYFVSFFPCRLVSPYNNFIFHYSGKRENCVL